MSKNERRCSPLEPRNANGRRVLIPHSVWPEEPCVENSGGGWTAVMKTCTAGVASRRCNSRARHR